MKFTNDAVYTVTLYTHTSTYWVDALVEALYGNFSALARDADNLFMAGRCISGDFISHAAFRVTGSAVATGVAAGKAASLFSKS